VLDELGPDYRLLAGANVVELLPRGVNKGTAVRAFMGKPPFAGRRPVFVGDDVTDLDGFAAAQALGGCGIAVGPRVAADYRLTDVPAVRGWLRIAP
jgi:trehalose 6-phosphate phosphatase